MIFRVLFVPHSITTEQQENKHSRSQGSRTLDDFVMFSKRVTENPIHVVMSAEELDTLKNKPEAKFYLLVVRQRPTFDLPLSNSLMENNSFFSS